jgi:uroporphyrinogen decarboxylase
MKIAFSPSVYEHAAFLIGKSPWEVSRDKELLFSGHAKAYKLYNHSPIVVGIDIYNLEAEAYGCHVQNPGGNGIPAITKGILNSIAEARALTPFNPKTDGRISIVIDVGVRLKKAFPDADVRVPVSGPFSIAISLMGFEKLFESIAFSPTDVCDFLKQLSSNQVPFCQAVVDAGLDVAFFESAAAPPLLSPRYFREIELPALKDAIKRVSEVVGHPVPCIIGGDTEPILDDILSTGTGYIICPAETDQKKFMVRFGNRTDVRVRINTNPLIIVKGSKSDIIAEVDRIIAIADGRPNILLGTGALPYETPPENILLIKEYTNETN